MRAGQQLEQDYRSVARDSCSRAVKDFAFAALDVGLYETNARQAGFVERADFNIIAPDVAKLDVTSLQAAGEVEPFRWSRIWKADARAGRSISSDWNAIDSAPLTSWPSESEQY